MPASGHPPAEVRAYAHGLAARLAAACGGLRAAYVHGSAVLGGWVPRRSDVDLLLVIADGTPGETVSGMCGALMAAAGSCPGRELEASVVTVTQAGKPAAPWPFALHTAGGPGRAVRAVWPGSGTPGDPDLIMHYAVCRARGWPAWGPPPQELVGALPRRTVLSYLADELRWGVAHAG
jgi:hypothetical protein